MNRKPRWNDEGRNWPNAAHSKFIESGRLCWHVQRWGRGPPLLLLHGTAAATHSWRDLAPLLAKTFTIIAPDLPGHGFTAGPPPGGLTMPAVARSIGDLLRTLDVSPRVIVGHSAGAAIALRMTLDNEVEPAGIVGLDAALLPFPGLVSKLFPAMAKLLFVNPLAPHIFANLARLSGETARFLKRSTGSSIDPDGLIFYERLFRSPGHIAGAITMMAEWDLDAFKNDLPRIQTPLLLIHGAADAAISPAKAREAAAMIDGATLELLPGLGHLAHEERPAEVAALIMKFAEGH